MVMEYIPGKSLFDLVKNEGVGPFRVPDAARLFLKVVDGLEAAHRAGLVHRDIKPSNIMITPEGEAKLLDLGLARALDDETGLTRANTVLGTLDYASPEQLRDAAKADVRSDLYSLGCTLYFALSGSPPFEGGDMINKIYKQRMEDPPPLENRARGVPAAFAAVVRKLMSKKPEERYQNAAELRADLARWTDPARVRAILGAEADAARSFRPPPPELAEDDLRLLDSDLGREPRSDLPPRARRRRAVARPPPPGPAAAHACTDPPQEIARNRSTVPPTQAQSTATRAGCIHFAIIAAAAGTHRHRFYSDLFPALSPIGAKRATSGQTRSILCPSNALSGMVFSCQRLNPVHQSPLRMTFLPCRPAAPSYPRSLKLVCLCQHIGQRR